MAKVQDRHQSGFTLIELIVVMIIIGILAGVLFTIMRGPMTQFVQVEQRANLVDIAETALLRMTREIRLALPNSVRVSGSAIEFLRTVDGGRYRRSADGSNSDVCADDTIDFTIAADCFEVLGPLNNAPSFNAGATQATCMAAGGVHQCCKASNTNTDDNYCNNELNKTKTIMFHKRIRYWPRR